MPDLTPQIGIKKPLGNENVSRASFNENWDIIDANAAPRNVAQMYKLTKDDGYVIDTISGTDLNSLLATGFYYGNNLGNAPGGAVYHRVSVFAASSTSLMQEATTNGGERYIRSLASGVWSRWVLQLNDNAPTWTNATLQNGWVSYDATRILKYRKDEKGFVEFDGYVKSGTVATDTAIFTLPTGYRPAGIDQSPIAVSGGFAQLRINSTGVVSIEVGTVTSGGNAQTWSHVKARFFVGN
jgi:hypothetical protein